jgi:hypothetical protein
MKPKATAVNPSATGLTGRPTTAKVKAKPLKVVAADANADAALESRNCRHVQ